MKLLLFLLFFLVFFQGEVEKSLGWRPIPLFDKDNLAELPSMQVGTTIVLCTVATLGPNLQFQLELKSCLS